ncbi:hypothetical protein GR217_34275 [Rhizobium leguminosarum]|uniref:Uncharacterized protein n=1 Tax=Rhizobium ruizarguesonis TaxID=2081791 RepID=A0AAE4Z0C8_9HYPH|nr:hypothetical protein [Rhizobium ruizarguesonis]NEI52687.1 hypothetical protein [Rhizobium ruizarguesonis]
MNNNGQGHAVEDRIREEMRHIGNHIADGIEKAGGGYGFALFVFERRPGGSVNYVADLHMRHLVELMKEFIERTERDLDRPPPPRR